MYRIPLLLFILSVTDGYLLWTYRKEVLCDHIFKQKYPNDKNDNTTVGFFNSSLLYLCLPEEVPMPNKIVYIVNYGKNGAGNFPDSAVYIDFPPPKRECMFGVALLHNPLIQDEEECSMYEFDAYDELKEHSRERRMCIFKYNNPFVKDKDNSMELFESNIGIWFQHIFTGCYALRFHVNNKHKYVAGRSIFFNTTYPRKEVEEPQLTCKYHTHPDLEKSRMTNFTLDISISPETGPTIQVAMISQRSKDTGKGCLWKDEPFLFVWTIDLRVDSLVPEMKDQHCDIKFMETVKGNYRKIVRCKFQLEVKATKSCFVYNVIDERCRKNTIWKPTSAVSDVPCLWVKHCDQMFDYWQHIETIQPKILMQSDKLLSVNSYLLLPIIAVVLIVSAVIGILCFRHYSRIEKKEINLYVNPHDDSNCDHFKPIDSDIIDNNEKKINHDNFSCDNIVLLYTNSSACFMALMKNFRITLAKMCSCSVHDWHDGAVWNVVAKVGAVSWFTNLLNNGCRVVWVDTPDTRSAVISNSNDDESGSNKLSKYYEIHDFRDMAFRGVLEVAKSKVNDVARQYRRHFVIRFEGLESLTNVDDPFLSLSPHARYYMPQHFMQLCSDLSTMKPEICKYKTKINEDVYRLFVYQLYKSQTQQHLKYMKMDSTI